ncbi:hypothetical protein Tco_0626459 [Tanacetum coccineum]|uniref:Tf2-1-like SH3-like domain-containing protein n=1 Tax=Tanacetum coccineum TaxID=301880 RepID=A0ABQ4WJQ2_9ASTR
MIDKTTKSVSCVIGIGAIGPPRPSIDGWHNSSIDREAGPLGLTIGGGPLLLGGGGPAGGGPMIPSRSTLGRVIGRIYPVRGNGEMEGIGVIRFRKRGKLNPRYIGPFKILERIGLVAYKLELPEELSTFHVSNLKKCLSDESLVIPMKELRLDDKLNFVEELVEIMDREVKKLKQSRIPIVKVRWNSKRGPEFTWECEDQFRTKYPHLFSNITPTSN